MNTTKAHWHHRLTCQRRAEDDDSRASSKYVRLPHSRRSPSFQSAIDLADRDLPEIQEARSHKRLRWLFKDKEGVISIVDLEGHHNSNKEQTSCFSVEYIYTVEYHLFSIQEGLKRIVHVLRVLQFQHTNKNWAGRYKLFRSQKIHIIHSNTYSIINQGNERDKKNNNKCEGRGGGKERSMHVDIYHNKKM